MPISNENNFFETKKGIIIISISKKYKKKRRSGSFGLDFFGIQQLRP
jgi:hypothetical protein